MSHDKQLVDSMTARMVTRPDTLDVLVCSNVFGDILTDLGAALTGSLGLAPSANLNRSARRDLGGTSSTQEMTEAICRAAEAT
jgi:isocitrate/isopropylmalate dehydrogenase